MKKLILLILISINLPVMGQKGIPVVSDIINYFTTSIVDDSLSFIRANSFYDTRIRKVINGIYIDASTGTNKLNSQLINNSVYYPFYDSSPEIAINQYNFSIVLSPLMFSFGYNSGEQDLTEIPLTFAFPPAPPNTAELSSMLKFTSLSFATHYIPYSLFWGYVYPSLGVRGNYTKLKFNSKETGIISVGLDAQIIFKFKNLYAGVSYTKYLLKTDYFNDQLFIKGGICFGWL